MGLAGHLLKRLLLVGCGYLLGVIAGAIAIIVVYSILAQLPNSPDYFDAMALSPLVLLLVPPVAAFVLLVTVYVTAAQALVAALLCEALGLRAPWLHLLFGALAAVSGFVIVSPTLLNGVSPSDWADLAIIAAGGFAGGWTYWLIAGRDAGFARTPLLRTA